MKQIIITIDPNAVATLIVAMSFLLLFIVVGIIIGAKVYANIQLKRMIRQSEELATKMSITNDELMSAIDRVKQKPTPPKGRVIKESQDPKSL